nr:MAG TPA: hypothetical protein [Caudoviricetes sp.]
MIRLSLTKNENNINIQKIYYWKKSPLPYAKRKKAGRPCALFFAY